MANPNNPKLSDEQKLAIVKLLANFASPTQIQKAVKQNWGIELTINGIRHYDADSNASRTLGAHWVAAFRQERELAKGRIGGLGVSHLSYRMRIYQGIVNKFVEFNPDGTMVTKNDAMLLGTLKQAATDVGGGFTNKIRTQGDGPVDERQEEIDLAQMLGVDVETLRRAKDSPVEIELGKPGRPRRADKPVLTPDEPISAPKKRSKAAAPKSAKPATKKIARKQPEA